MADHKARANRIILVREGHDLTQEQFAKKLGATRGAVGNWELGKGIKKENLRRISKLFRVPFDWLDEGVADAPAMPSNPDLAFALTKPQRPLVKSYDPDVQDGGDELPLAALHEGGRINVPPGEIPQVEARIGLGHSTDEPTIHIPVGGGSIAAVPIVATWKVPERAWRRHMAGPLDRIHIVECEGDSMEPTIRNGDFVFIDTSRRIPSPPGIFALNDGFAQTLKRLELVPNTDPPRVMIIPDNGKHPTFERTIDELNIVGRYICRLTGD